MNSKIFAMSSVEKVIDDKRICVKYSSLFGSSLLLLIRKRWSAKKELKSSIFFLKSVTKAFFFFFEMIGIFLLFRKILNKDNILESFSEYFVTFPQF